MQADDDDDDADGEQEYVYNSVRGSLQMVYLRGLLARARARPGFTWQAGQSIVFQRLRIQPA